MGSQAVYDALQELKEAISQELARLSGVKKPIEVQQQGYLWAIGDALDAFEGTLETIEYFCDVEEEE